MKRIVFISEPLLKAPEVLQAFRRAAEDLGVTLCIWFIPNPAHATRHEGTMLFHWGFAPEWSKLYQEVAHDLPGVVDAAIRFGRPAIWRDLLAAEQPTPKGALYRALYEEFQQLHPVEGFVFPVFGPFSTGTLVSCALDPPLQTFDDPRFTALSAAADKALRMIALIRNQEYRNAIRLSPREQAVLRGLGAGLSKKEIARDMDIAPASVDTYARRIFFKLEVDDRVEAVVKAVSLGLVKL